MYIVTLSEPAVIHLRKSGNGGRAHVFGPHRAYVVTGFVWNRLKEDFQGVIHKVSSLEPRTRNFVAKPPHRGRVLLYNGSGGYGDQLITWPLPAILTRLGYEVHVAVEPGNEPLWWTVPHCASVVSLPVEYEEWKLYDHHAVFESVGNFDEHPDQRHPLDAMLWKLGIDPSAVPDSDKSLPPLLTQGELAEVDKLTDGRPYGLYQLAASIPLRSLPPAASAEALAVVASKRQDLLWLAVHDQYIPKDYVKEASELGLPNVTSRVFKTIRSLLAAASKAKLVVGPDSFLIHAAGVAGVPAVGMWGPTPPDLRVRYYANHKAIYNQPGCRYAPCLCAGAAPPPYCPSTVNGACGVVASGVEQLKQLAL